MFKSFEFLTLCSSCSSPACAVRQHADRCLRGKLLVSFICVSAVILFNTAYSDNSTTSYFNFLSLPTAPPIQQQQPPPIEKTEIPAIIDFPGGRLIGSLAPSATGTVRITAPVAFILKRNNQTNGQTDQSDQSDQQTNFINPVENLSGILKFTIKSISHQLSTINHQPSAILHRYPKIGFVEDPSGSANLGSPTRITLTQGDNIEIELVAQQNIVYFQIPYGEQIEITNIEFLDNTQLTMNCDCKQVKEIDLSLLYNSFKH